MLNSSNPTAWGRWQARLQQAFPDPTPLPLTHVYWIGPFENAGYQGLFVEYPPEQGVDLGAAYPGKTGEVGWQRLPLLEGAPEPNLDLGAWMPAAPWSVLYVAAQVQVGAPQEDVVRTQPRRRNPQPRLRP